MQGEKVNSCDFLLQKLGIDKLNPDDLTDEELGKFSRLDFDTDTISWQRGMNHIKTRVYLKAGNTPHTISVLFAGCF